VRTNPAGQPGNRLGRVVGGPHRLKLLKVPVSRMHDPCGKFDNAKLSVGFTSHADQIQNALKAAQAGGLTAMLDAVNVALKEMKYAKNPRKSIVIVSDGGDNHSRYTSTQIEALVRQADVQSYAMGVFGPVFSLGLTPEEISGPRLLSEIATQTGGRAFDASLNGDLPSVAARIAIELRNQYVLGYYPKNGTHDGKYRKWNGKVAQPSGVSALRTHWRQGYHFPARCVGSYRERGSMAQFPRGSQHIQGRRRRQRQRIRDI